MLIDPAISGGTAGKLESGCSKTKVANVKLRMLPLPFLFSSLFPFFLSFSFAAVISQLIERKIKSLSFGPFFTASFVRFVFKKSARYTI